MKRHPGLRLLLLLLWLPLVAGPARAHDSLVARSFERLRDVAYRHASSGAARRAGPWLLKAIEQAIERRSEDRELAALGVELHRGQI